MKRPQRIFYGWWIVAVVAACRFLADGLFTNGFTVYFLPISRDLGLSRAALSLVSTMRSLENGLDGPLIGYLVDRLGGRFMVRVGGTLMGLGFVLLAFTNSFLTLFLVFLCTLALGVSAGVHHPFMAVTNQWFARQRTMAITLGNLGGELGSAFLTPLIALVVLNRGWRQAAVLSGILIPLAMLPLSFFLHNTPESRGLLRDGDLPREPMPASEGKVAAMALPVEEREDFTVREALQTAAFWHLALAGAFRMLGKVTLHVHLVPLLVWKGLDESTATLLVGVYALAQIPFRLPAAFIADRWSKARVASLACLAGVAAVASILLGKEGSLGTGLLFVLLFALAESGNTPGWSLVGEFFGRQKFATLRGTIALSFTPIAHPAPTLLGWAYDKTGSYGLALLPLAGAYGVASLLYWLLRHPRRPAVLPASVHAGLSPTAVADDRRAEVLGRSRDHD